MTPNDMLKKAYETFNNSNMPEGLKKCASDAMNMLKFIRNDRMHVRAGCARAKILGKKVLSCSIEWNSTLFSRMTEEQQYNTISHEFSHLVEFFHSGTSDHGYMWQKIHLACGGTATRTHNYDIQGLRNNVKRITVCDILTGKEYRITQRNYNQIKHIPRYVVMKTEVYNGRELIAAHNHY